MLTLLLPAPGGVGKWSHRPGDALHDPDDEGLCGPGGHPHAGAQGQPRRQEGECPIHCATASGIGNDAVVLMVLTSACGAGCSLPMTAGHAAWHLCEGCFPRHGPRAVTACRRVAMQLIPLKCVLAKHARHVAQLTEQLSFVTAERGELAEGAAGAEQCLPESHAPSPPRPARCWRSIWRVWRWLRPADLWRWPARLWRAGRLWSASRLPAGLWGWIRAVLTASIDAQLCFSRLTPLWGGL